MRLLPRHGEGRKGPLDGSLHRHVAVEVGVAVVRRPAGPYQLRPDREGQAREDLVEGFLDGVGAVVEVLAILVGERLDLDEDVGAECFTIAEDRCEDDATWRERPLWAVHARRNDLLASSEELLHQLVTFVAVDMYSNQRHTGSSL